jgi:hypothetical protein
MMVRDVSARRGEDRVVCLFVPVDVTIRDHDSLSTVDHQDPVLLPRKQMLGGLHEQPPVWLPCHFVATFLSSIHC